MRYAIVVVAASLALGGCVAKPPVVTFPLGSFAYEIGVLSQRVEQLCQQKKLTPADCEHARDLAAVAKAKINAPPEAGTDWAEIIGGLVKLGAKAAL
jgi:outer membrane murein-binding lipoprotein Lpp